MVRRFFLKAQLLSLKFPECVERAVDVFTGVQWSFINNSLQSHNYSRSAKGSSSLDRIYSRKIRKQLVHHKQVNVPSPGEKLAVLLRSKMKMYLVFRVKSLCDVWLPFHCSSCTF